MNKSPAVPVRTAWSADNRPIQCSAEFWNDTRNGSVFTIDNAVDSQRLNNASIPLHPNPPAIDINRSPMIEAQRTRRSVEAT